MKTGAFTYRKEDDMTVQDKPAAAILPPSTLQPKSITIQFWDPGCDPHTPTGEFEATFKQTHEGPDGYHEYGFTMPESYVEIHVPLATGIEKIELWELALSLNHVPLDEAILPGDFYVARWKDCSFVLRCKEVRNNLVISENEHYVLALNDCVKIQDPYPVRK